MAYDLQRQVTLLFGGGGLNDTWTWNGSDWQQLHPATQPPARSSASMTYDSRRNEMLLFGGVGSDGKLLNDTWTWNGNDWTRHQATLSPPPLSGASIAFDSAQGHAVLFGGLTNGDRVGTLLSQTWLWNGQQWEQHAGLAPEARTGASMSWDEARNKIVLFGGTNGVGALDDTWIWEQGTWEQLTLPHGRPPARAWANLFYDNTRQLAVLSGGGGNSLPGQPDALLLSDTWTWNGTSWQQVTTVNAPAGSYNSAAYDRVHKRAIIFATHSGKPHLGNKSSGALAPSSIKASPSSEVWIWE
jgi:hypothetical protein